ncbi:YciI family protein [Sphingomonas arantia]|uniref:YciI family protein n=1 Tax=Sphingomonas arantia TaxID=1460676 RepID=A0ABW4U0E2_9SPHN
MFVLTLTYVAPLEAVDAEMDAHVAWLKQGFAAGVFVAAGRQIPRTGGVILALGERTLIEELVKTDPFATAGVATYAVTEFRATMVGDGYEGLQA